MWVEPDQGVLEALQGLCADTRNTVYIVSGETTENLGVWYNQVKDLGVVCEYGYQYRGWKGRWVNLIDIDLQWQNIVLEIFKKYEIATEGSWIEKKKASIVWKYSNIDREFALLQSNSLIKELKKFNKSLSNQQEIDIVQGENYIEVRPFGMNKGTVAEMLLKKVFLEKGKMDFVLIVGNSLQDEEMISSIRKNRQYYPEFFVSRSYHYLCTVGQKPSNAAFYLENVQQVTGLLQQLANCQENSESKK